MSPSYSIFVFIVVVAQGILIVLYIIQMYSSEPYFFTGSKAFMSRHSRRFPYKEKSIFRFRNTDTEDENEFYRNGGVMNYPGNTVIRDHTDDSRTSIGQRTGRMRPGLLRTDDLLILDNERPVLMVAVFSAPIYSDRRQAIRESWMQDCRPEKNVICKFFTDALNVHGDPLDNVTMDKIRSESQRNRGDLILIDSPGGENFALRYLSVIEWAISNVDFDFLLRIDDDHYLCLERLLQELPFRPRKRLYWGHLHCYPGVVRIDDGWLVMSADLVKEFWHKRDELMCHKYADQAVAMWIYETMKWKDVNWFGDYRIYHHPPVAMISTFKIRKEICHTFISLHGAYPIEQRVFHMILEKERRTMGNIYDVPPVIDTCPHLRQNFNWKWFELKYHAEPVPCKHNPIWVSNGSIFLGRSLDIRKLLSDEKRNEERYEKNKLMIKLIQKDKEKPKDKQKKFNVVKQVALPVKEKTQGVLQIDVAPNAPKIPHKALIQPKVTAQNKSITPLKLPVQQYQVFQNLNKTANNTKALTSPFLHVVKKELNISTRNP